MIHEIGPIVQEDKDPQKIRHALARGAAGVIVPNPIPEAVMREWEVLKAGGPATLDKAGEYVPAIIADATAPDHCRWTFDDSKLNEVRRWLMDEFKWAAASRLCRSPDNTQGRNALLRFWINNAQNLPWHIDRSQSNVYPDIHIHIADEGMRVASPGKPMKMTFSDSKTSPHLQLPGLSLTSIREKNAEKIMLKKLTEYLREREVPLLKLEPGQTLFFNEKCLHMSAGRRKMRLRAAIF